MAIPSVTNKSAATNLGRTAEVLDTTLDDLRVAVDRAEEACHTQEVGGALEVLGMLSGDLKEYTKGVKDGKLLPLPLDTVCINFC